MTAEIIDFTTRRRTPDTDDAPRKTVGTLTTTAKDERLRSARREAWQKADALRNYWHQLLNFTDAVSRTRRTRAWRKLAGAMRSATTVAGHS